MFSFSVSKRINFVNGFGVQNQIVNDVCITEFNETVNATEFSL